MMIVSTKDGPDYIADLSKVEMPKMDTVIYKENGKYIVQGLQYDIVSFGATETEALQDFELTVRAERHFREANGGSLEDIGPAPQQFWDKAGKEIFN